MKFTRHLRLLTLGTLWHRHSVLKIAQATGAMVGALFIFYICLDASINSREIRSLGSAFAIARHYLFQFLMRLPQLLPFALAVTSCHLLLRMQRQYETTSLIMSGASRLSILMPFLQVSLFSSLLVFACSEGWFFPTTELKSVQTRSINWLTSSLFSSSSDQFEAIPLDHKLERWLIYHEYDEFQKTFQDVFLIQNDNSWWHFDSLKLTAGGDETAITTAHGHGADRFENLDNRHRIWSEHHEETAIELEMNLHQLQQEARSPQQMPALDLWQSLRGDYPKIQRPKLQAYLYFRLIQPLLCLFAPLPAAALTLNHHRHVNIFWVYLTSITSLVALFTIQQSGLLLASAGRLHPLWGIALPMLMAFFAASVCVKKS